MLNVEQHRLLEMIEAMAGVGHWRYEVPEKQVSWSDEVYRIHGVDRSSFDPNFDAAVGFYHPDDQASVRQFIAQAIHDGEDFTFQLRLKRRDGDLRDVACKATCEIGPTGKVVAIFGVFQDVTDQVRTLERVKKSEARYRLLTENANDIVTEMDEQGLFRYVSPAVFKVTGYHANEVVGRPALDFIHPEDQSAVQKAFARALKGAAGWRIEYRVLCKGGRVIWVEARPTLAQDSLTGAPTGVTDVIRDITDHKLAENALADSEARYRLLAENASDMISMLRPSGHIHFITPGCRQVLGYEPEEMIGRRTLDMIHPQDAAHVRAYYSRIRETKAPLADPLEFRARHKNGRWVWLEGRPKMFFDPISGEPVEIHDVVRDVTLRKTLEADLRRAQAEAEAAAAVKSDFLANMSHELRTPLTSILGFSKLLGEQRGLDDQGRRYLQRVSDASQSLLTTVNDILDFSKLEAGQVEIAARPINPAAVIQGALSLLGHEAESKGLVLRGDCDGLPALLMADDTRIRQILLNLIGNAVKFTHQGGVTVRARYDESVSRLRCEVIDTGQGIAADSLERLFRRFSQVDASTTRSHGGTGLGLAICKGLAEAMGGTVGTESAPGEGSRFWFEIPCPRAIAPTESASDALESARQLQGLRMLVADDNAINRTLISLILAPFGVELTQARAIQDAVTLAQSGPFDIIFVGGASDKDRVAAAQSIRKVDGPNQSIPIVALAKGADESARSRLAPFSARLATPIIAADLLRLIDVLSPAKRGDAPDPNGQPQSSNERPRVSFNIKSVLKTLISVKPTGYQRPA